MRVLSLFLFLAVTAIFVVPDAKAFSFGNPLVDAADMGDRDKVVQLLKSGYLPDTRGDFGVTALMRAAYRDNTEIVGILMESGAYVNAADIGGATALHLAAQAGNTEVVNKLLSYDAFVDIPDKEQWTPLMRAVMAKRTDVVKTLVNHGADMALVNDMGESVLVHAAMIGVPEIMETILGNKSFLKVPEEQRETAIAIAEKKGNENIGRMISATEGHIKQLASDNGEEIKKTAPAFIANSEPVPVKNLPDRQAEQAELTKPYERYDEEKNTPVDTTKGHSFGGLHLWGVQGKKDIKPVEDDKAEEVAAPNAPIDITPKPAVKPVAAATATQQPSDKKRGWFTMQLGAFSNEGQALSVWNSIKQNNKDIVGEENPNIVKFSEKGKSDLYRLRAGSFQWQDVAESNCSALRTRNIECFVVANSPPAEIPQYSYKQNDEIERKAKETKEAMQKIERARSEKKAQATAKKPVGVIDEDNMTISEEDRLAEMIIQKMEAERLAKEAMGSAGQFPGSQQSYNTASNKSYENFDDYNVAAPQKTSPAAPSPVANNTPQPQQNNDLPWLKNGDPVRTNWQLPPPPPSSSQFSQMPYEEQQMGYQQQLPPPGQIPSEYNYENLAGNSQQMPQGNMQGGAGYSMSPDSMQQQLPQMSALQYENEKRRVEEEVRKMARKEFFRDQGLAEPEQNQVQQSQQQVEPYKRINNDPRYPVSEAVMVPDSTYFSNNSSGMQPTQQQYSAAQVGGGVWLNIDSFPTRDAANDYGDRMFRYDENLRNMQIMLVDTPSAYGNIISMRVGPLNETDAYNLCGTIQSSGLRCNMFGGGTSAYAGSPASAQPGSAMINNTQPYSNQPARTVAQPAMSGYWINLGTFVDTSEAEYYWMFLQEDNGDILNNLKYDMKKPGNNSMLSDDAVQLTVGPFGSQSRANQICDIMKYRNVACLVQ